MKFPVSADIELVTLGNTFNFGCLNFLNTEGLGLALLLITTQEKTQFKCRSQNL